MKKSERLFAQLVAPSLASDANPDAAERDAMRELIRKAQETRKAK